MAVALRAVFFDAAGTLFHPAEPIGALYAAVAARHGIRVAAQDLEAPFRHAFATAPPLAFPGVAGAELRAREKAWWKALVARVFQGVRFADFDAYFDDLFDFFAGAAAWRLDPDAIPLFRALRARGLARLVVSNFDARVRALLASLGLAPLVDHVVLSSEVGAAKPDPAIFEAALALGPWRADEVVHVGDTVGEDLAGARAAGIRALLIGDADLAGSVPDATVLPRLGEVITRL